MCQWNLGLGVAYSILELAFRPSGCKASNSFETRRNLMRSHDNWRKYQRYSKNILRSIKKVKKYINLIQFASKNLSKKRSGRSPVPLGRSKSERRCEVWPPPQHHRVAAAVWGGSRSQRLWFPQSGHLHSVVFCGCDFVVVVALVVMGNQHRWYSVDQLWLNQNDWVRYVHARCTVATCDDVEDSEPSVLGVPSDKRGWFKSSVFTQEDDWLQAHTFGS